MREIKENIDSDKMEDLLRALEKAFPLEPIPSYQFHSNDKLTGVAIAPDAWKTSRLYEEQCMVEDEFVRQSFQGKKWNEEERELER